LIFRTKHALYNWLGAMQRATVSCFIIYSYGRAELSVIDKHIFRVGCIHSARDFTGTKCTGCTHSLTHSLTLSLSLSLSVCVCVCRNVAWRRCNRVTW